MQTPGQRPSQLNNESERILNLRTRDETGECEKAEGYSCPGHSAVEELDKGGVEPGVMGGRS